MSWSDPAPRVNSRISDGGDCCLPPGDGFATFLFDEKGLLKFLFLTDKRIEVKTIHMTHTKKIVVGLFSSVLLMWVGMVALPPSSFAVSMGTPDSLELSPSQRKTQEGVAALKDQDYTTAEAAFQESIQLDSQNVKALLGLAEVSWHQGQTKNAESYFQQAIQGDPKSAVVQHIWGQYLYSQHRLPAAEKALRNAIRLDSTHSLYQAHLGLGDVLALQGKGNDAIASYHTVLSIVPNLAVAHLKIGQVHQLQQHPAQAEQAFRKAIELDPKQAEALNNLAWIMTEKNEDLDQALRWAQDAVSLYPKFPPFYDTLGWVYRARGELEHAMATLEKGETLDPKNPEILYHLGVVYMDQNRHKEAAQQFTIALSLNQPFPDAQEARKHLQILKSKQSRHPLSGHAFSVVS